MAGNKRGGLKVHFCRDLYDVGECARTLHSDGHSVVSRAASAKKRLPDVITMKSVTWLMTNKGHD